MSLLKNIFVAIFILSIFSNLNAQENKKDKHNEQVTIVGSYEPKINDAFKINTKPVLIEPEVQHTEFVFKLPNIKESTNIELNSIKAVDLRNRNKTDLYNSFFKVGFGSRLSPYIDFYHSKNKKGDYNFIANFYHYSSFNNIPDYSPSPFSNTSEVVTYQKFLDNHILDLGIKFGLKTNRYYGYIPDDFPTVTIPDNELKQMFNLIQANVGFSSNYKRKNKLHHEIGLTAYYYFDRHKTSEMNTKFNFDLHKGFDVVDVLDYQNLGIKGVFDFYSNSDSLVNSSEFYFGVTPYFTANYGAFNFNAGINLGLLNTNNSTFHFWPDVEVQMNVVPEIFTIFAGIKGGMEKQSYFSLTEENPYLSSVSQLKWMNEKINVFGGLKLSIAQIAGFQIKTGWRTFEDMGFFINTSEYQTPAQIPVGPLNKFTTAFDDGNEFYTEASISISAGKQFKINLGGEYHTYSLDSLKQAYHKPLAKAFVGGSYNFADKVKFSLEMIFNGKRYALNTN
ncbi:MAG: hypothetical protein C0598_10285 [Marinilabiliales bacterium]|nr:MAG: hypothetical protein C0598_10285 [Marinilabiliales bacterium]